jgi:hypothetical protein
MQEEWAGTTSGWKRACYPVTGGAHTYKWVYIKNNSGTQGSDAGWVDYISFPPPLASTLYAGWDEMVCEGSEFTAGAYATNYASIFWSTSGTGTFDDNTVLNTIYTPSTNDITAGEVTLSMAMTDAQGAAFSDNLLLTFTAIPDSPVAPMGPEGVNLAGIYTSDYTTEAVAEATSYSWIVEPAEAGMMVNSGEAGTIVWNRNWAGTATIKVMATNQCGQSAPSQGLEVIVVNGTVGIIDPVAGFSIFAYPNPADERLFVQLESPASTRVSLSLVNLLGTTVFTAETLLTGNGAFVIPVGNLGSGVYLLVARDGSASRTMKIIIQ